VIHSGLHTTTTTTTLPLPPPLSSSASCLHVHLLPLSPPLSRGWAAGHERVSLTETLTDLTSLHTRAMPPRPIPDLQSRWEEQMRLNHTKTTTRLFRCTVCRARPVFQSAQDLHSHARETHPSDLPSAAGRYEPAAAADKRSVRARAFRSQAAVQP
jgi:hypothetical protein